jgi:hypothetical protein
MPRKHHTARQAYGSKIFVETTGPVTLEHMHLGYTDADERIPVPPEMLRTPVPIRPKDKVTILYGGEDSRPIITEPVTGKTLQCLFNALERGLSRPLDPKAMRYDLICKVYSTIGRFRRDRRLGLVRKFEAGKLTPRDLVGDHSGWTGGFVHGKDGIWEYGLDS